MAARQAPLLTLALALLACGLVQAAPVNLPAGRKWIKLVGRGACRGSSGWLGPDVCGTPRGDALMLKMIAGGPWTTWRMKPVSPADYELGNGAALTLQVEGRTLPLPKCGSGLNAPACPSFLGAASGCANAALSMAPTNGSLSQFALEKVNGTTDQYYIRTHARGSCAKRYLGAVYKANVRGCGGAQLGLHTRGEVNVHTRWQIIAVSSLPPCQVCFPSSATVETQDRGRVAMPDLRPGDRVLSVGYDGRLSYQEVYMFSRFDPSALGAYKVVTAVGAGPAVQARTLKLSPFHYMAASREVSPACAALAAGAIGGNGADAGLQAAWTAAAQELDWAREHVMRLPTDLAPGMVAWLAGPEGGAAAPACITSVNGTWEAGAFSPFVRARGLVVDGVVASPHVRGGYIWGRLWLPKSADLLVPAVLERLFAPYYWLYKALGPQLTWRINRHPLFGAWDMGNIVLGNLAVWGQLAVVVAMAAALARALRRRRRRSKPAMVSEPKRKAE
ncbi:hypothetical protein ABPG75_002619 [Micractinium tetrahymenae]